MTPLRHQEYQLFKYESVLNLQWEHFESTSKRWTIFLQSQYFSYRALREHKFKNHHPQNSRTANATAVFLDQSKAFMSKKWGGRQIWDGFESLQPRRRRFLVSFHQNQQRSAEDTNHILITNSASSVKWNRNCNFWDRFRVFFWFMLFLFTS